MLAWIGMMAKTVMGSSGETKATVRKLALERLPPGLDLNIFLTRPGRGADSVTEEINAAIAESLAAVVADAAAAGADPVADEAVRERRLAVASLSADLSAAKARQKQLAGDAEDLVRAGDFISAEIREADAVAAGRMVRHLEHRLTIERSELANAEAVRSREFDAAALEAGRVALLAAQRERDAAQADLLKVIADRLPKLMALSDVASKLYLDFQGDHRQEPGKPFLEAVRAHADKAK